MIPLIANDIAIIDMISYEYYCLWFESLKEIIQNNVIII